MHGRRAQGGRRPAVRPVARGRDGRAAPARFLWLGLWPRLIAVALVPVLAFGSYAVAHAADVRASYHRMQAVGQDVDHTTRLMRLTFALHREKVYAQMLRAMAQLNFGPQDAERYAGIDVASETTASRAATDRALEGIEDWAVDYPALRSLRARVDAYRSRPMRPGENVYSPIEDLASLFEDVSSATAAELAKLHRRLPALSNRLAGGIQTLQASAAVAGSLIDTIMSLYAAHFPSDGRDAAMAGLASANALLLHNVDALETTLDPANAVAWSKFKDTPSFTKLMIDIVVVFHDDDGLIDPTLPEPLVPIGVSFANAQRVLDDAAHFVDTIGTAVNGVARDDGDAAETAFAESLMIMGGAVAATVLFTGLAVLSIRRPIRRLAAHARRVSSGDLRESELAVRIRDIADVSDALNEAVRNMQRAADQADALANGSLEADCLSETVPGEMGQALHRSVTNLRRALRHQEELQQRLTQLATHDPLTGLRNRTGAVTAIEQALARAERHDRHFALLFLDLDGFKTINDVYGHEVGDQLLRTVADRVREGARQGDVAARLGGDEFVIIAEAVETPDHALAIAERLLEALVAPISLATQLVEVRASVGVAYAKAGTPSSLLVAADIAMRRAKAGGKNRVAVFDDDVERELREDLQLAKELREALTHGDLVVWYQPIVDTDTLAVHSVEALLRWIRPDGSMVSPARFIPIAEQSDLISDVDRWVLASVLSDLEAWQSDPLLASISVAVNLSGRHLLSGNLVTDVAASLRNHDVPPDRLLVEITETVLVADLQRTGLASEGLHRLGVRVALDDFGTGYTSLHQLATLSLDEIKIDATFVRALNDSRTRAVVEAMIDLATTLGHDVVAEGVETLDQLEWLRMSGCTFVQGFLIARPMPRQALAAWAHDPHPRALTAGVGATVTDADAQRSSGQPV